MIESYVNDNHGTWDQFWSEFTYALRTAVNEITGKAQAELFLGRKLITPFKKLVMVCDGTVCGRKRSRQAEASTQEQDIGQYSSRPRIKKATESRPSRGEMQDQGGPVLSRGRRFQKS
ncbi:hypothetical protein TNCV_2697971 [Trichonephila clavipes]|nr:hypothetical protein TNCV_2697971 [Trichonephila clavipes]